MPEAQAPLAKADESEAKHAQLRLTPRTRRQRTIILLIILVIAIYVGAAVSAHLLH